MSVDNMSRGEALARAEMVSRKRPNSQKDDNIALVDTPLKIAQEMILLYIEANQKHLVFIAPKFVFALTNDLGVNPKDILFVSDSKFKTADAIRVGTHIYEWDFTKSICVNYVQIENKAANLFYQSNKMPITNNLAIVGNPPYQKEDGGFGKSAESIYPEFVIASMKLNPRYLSMIIPSRWMIGGKGLEDFRSKIQNDVRMKTIEDFPNPKAVFPDVVVAGGVCYFLRDRDYNGPCMFNGTLRFLNTFDTIIRDNVALGIVSKIILKHRGRYLNQVASSSKPYGIRGNAIPIKKGTPCWFKQKTGLGFVDPNTVKDPRKDINTWRVIASKAPIGGSANFTYDVPLRILNEKNAFVICPGQICTEVHIVLASFKTKKEAENFNRYIHSKFAGALLKAKIISQDITKEKYGFIPYLEDYTRRYSDEDLYKMFDLNQEQISCIEQAIKI